MSLASITTILAQEFAANDSRWIYNYNGYWSIGRTDIQYQQDTILDNRLTKIFSITTTRLIKKDSSRYIENIGPIFLRSDKGIIESSTDGLYFDTLINFKAEIGKSWNVYRRNSWYTDTLNLTVLDTLSRKFSGINLFTQVVKYKFTYLPAIIDTVFEFIGAQKFYIDPFDLFDVAGDGGQGGIIRCFQNKLLGIVGLNINSSAFKYPYSCDNLTSTFNNNREIAKIEIQNSIINNTISINNYSTNIESVKFIDLLGRIVFKKSLNLGVNNIDISQLSPGIYCVFSFKSCIGKIIKQ